MKNSPRVSNATPTISSFTDTEPVYVRQLIKELMNSFLPLAIARRSFIINDVAPAFNVCVDRQILAFIMGKLLNNIISTTKAICIRVEAVKKAEAIQLRVRINAANFYSTMTGDYSQVLQAAYQLGGNIYIYNQGNEGMVVSLSLEG